MADELTFWRSGDLRQSRRDFLTLAGFSVAASAIAACSRAPVQKAIPLVKEPETLTPGVARWYASTCAGCSAGCGLLVKTRDGRPIKIEGNTESTLFGGTCAAGQATVLSLYDGERLRGPLWLGRPDTWDAIDERIERRLAAAATRGGAIVLLSSTVTSPSTRALIGEWSRRYPTFRHVEYDAVSYSALRSATADCFGVAGLPHFRFDRAATIIGLEADFLGTWLSPVEFARQYATRRRPDSPAPMSRHVQFESGLSLTGSNADHRVAIAPTQLPAVAMALLAAIAERAGVELAIEPDRRWLDDRELHAVATDLWRHRGKSLVVTGSQDYATHVVVHATNALLGNIGATVDVARTSNQKQGDDGAMTQLVADMLRGDVHVLMMHGVNPVYDFIDRDQFIRALESVALTISFAGSLDETSSRTHAVCPEHHFLEAWNDAEPIAGAFSLAQPTIGPIFDTRSAQDSLLAWSGATPDYYEYIRSHWRQHLFARQTRFDSFDAFWDRALHDGVFDAAPPSSPAVPTAAWKAALREAVVRRPARGAFAGELSSREFELHLYETVAIGDGQRASNPWLQELPDPITKVTWGNYAVLSRASAADLKATAGDVVRVSMGDLSIELPVYVQPGQADRTVSIAVGYGRERAGKVGNRVGANAYSFAAVDEEGFRQYAGRCVSLAPTGRHEPLAATQDHFSMEGHPIVREATLTAFLSESSNAVESDEDRSLWDPRPQGDHQWGMVVDLNVCTGCSACVTACQAENNVPVVGRDEVRRGREMHWLRIDAYAIDPERGARLAMLPMMCQHCENAPCETVCPVLATVHSSDGINQQVYNRCVGTRYCANNCPYKVRRFNWFAYAQNDSFDFNMNDPVGRMVLNPDVVVRSRGVMEKCSLCVQRIQAGKLLALQEHRALADGDIQTACEQACPADAIVFGDLNDPASRVSQRRRDRRHYEVLGELGTRPHVGYLSKVRNPLEPSAS